MRELSFLFSDNSFIRKHDRHHSFGIVSARRYYDKKMISLIFFLLSAMQIPTDFNFRIHKKNGWFGPETKFDGKSGYIRKIQNEKELNEFLAKKRGAPEVLYIPDAMLNEKVTDLITQKYNPLKFLQAVFVYTTNTSETSCASKFPNKQQSSYSSDFVWNPYGNGEMFFKYDFPIMYPPKRVSDALLKLVEKDGDKAGIYIDLVMKGRSGIEYCLKYYGDEDKHMCDPIGGLSLYGSFDEKIAGNQAVWLISGIDSFGIVPYAQVGADYSISGFVATLAAIDSLKNLKWKEAAKTLRYAFFDAEEVGYLGSERFLSEIENFKCNDGKNNEGNCSDPVRPNTEYTKIKLSEIDSVIEVKNVGLHSNENEIYAHTQKTDAEQQFVESVKESLGEATPLKIESPSEKVPGIPPSSTNTFLRHKNDIKHIVFTGHKGEFINKNIGKPSDNVYDSDYITKSATVVARTVASLCFPEITKEQLNEIQANFSVVDSLMNGFVNAPNDSELIHELFPNASLPTDHVSLYSGIYAGYSYKLKHRIIERFLKDIVATNVTNVNCTSDNDCSSLWPSDGKCSRSKVCERSMIRPHLAYSMAIEYSNKNHKFVITNNTDAYVNFAETQWTHSDIKYVLLPSPSVGRVSIGLGIVILAVTTYFGVSLWNSNLEHLKK